MKRTRSNAFNPPIAEALQVPSCGRRFKQFDLRFGIHKLTSERNLLRDERASGNLNIFNCLLIQAMDFGEPFIGKSQTPL